jgi:hypothetical protein
MCFLDLLGSIVCSHSACTNYTIKLLSPINVFLARLIPVNQFGFIS